MSFIEELDEEKQKLILKHLDLVIQQNKIMNLTRIDTYEEGFVLHVEDSLSGLPEIYDAPMGLYGDIGTGAGFPGIPLAIATSRETVLVEAKKKKADALKMFVSELGMEKSIRVFEGRAELMARFEPESFSVLTARALSKLSVLMELASPLLKKEGLLICYKAQMEDEESEDAENLEHMLGMKKVNDRQFMLDGTYHRRIVTFKKVGAPRVKLPRQEGMAQKNPLRVK